MYKSVLALLLLLGISSSYLQAQPNPIETPRPSDGDKTMARQLGRAGVLEADKGNLARALELLQQAHQLDPEDPIYRYEIAYVHYSQKDYRRTIQIIDSLLPEEGAEDVFYQLLGNSHDILGDTAKAIEIYDAGLKRFPNSGPLHLERGMMAARAKDINSALQYWEEGIDRAPEFSSNYYWAAKFYCDSDEPLWGVIYGETFINLERNTKRTIEMSEILYNAYHTAIRIAGDSASVAFSHHNIIRVPGKGAKIALPFSSQFEMAMMLAITTSGAIADPGLSLATLARIQAAFTNLWFSKGLDKQYPVPLFEWRRQIIGEGHFDAYYRWLLSQGASDEAGRWAAENSKMFQDFMDWFKAHRLPTDGKRRFSRVAIETQ